MMSVRLLINNKLHGYEVIHQAYTKTWLAVLYHRIIGIPSRRPTPTSEEGVKKIHEFLKAIKERTLNAEKA